MKKSINILHINFQFFQQRSYHETFQKNCLNDFLVWSIIFTSFIPPVTSLMYTLHCSHQILQIIFLQTSYPFEKSKPVYLSDISSKTSFLERTNNMSSATSTLEGIQCIRSCQMSHRFTFHSQLVQINRILSQLLKIIFEVYICHGN